MEQISNKLITARMFNPSELQFGGRLKKKSPLSWIFSFFFLHLFFFQNRFEGS